MKQNKNALILLLGRVYEDGSYINYNKTPRSKMLGVVKDGRGSYVAMDALSKKLFGSAANLTTIKSNEIAALNAIGKDLIVIDYNAKMDRAYNAKSERLF